MSIWRLGTTEEGARNALISEDLFDELVSLISERDKREFYVDWGQPIVGTCTFFEPSVYYDETDTTPHPDQLTLPEVGD